MSLSTVTHRILLYILGKVHVYAIPAQDFDDGVALGLNSHATKSA